MNDCLTAYRRRARHPVRATAAIVGTILLLGGCTTDGDSAGHDPGLIRNPAFDNEQGRLARPWMFLVHADAQSYELEVADAVATIRRTGKEPWARLAQRIPSDRLESLEGRTLAFSIDIRADLNTDQWGDPFEPTALVVKVWTQSGEDSIRHRAMSGPRMSLNERLELDPAASIPEWQRHEIEFTLPENASRLEVSVTMTTGGTLELRFPSLKIIR